LDPIPNDAPFILRWDFENVKDEGRLTSNITVELEKPDGSFVVLASGLPSSARSFNWSTIASMGLATSRYYVLYVYLDAAPRGKEKKDPSMPDLGVTGKFGIVAIINSNGSKCLCCQLVSSGTNLQLDIHSSLHLTKLG
jgi:hypothetical protein